MGESETNKALVAFYNRPEYNQLLVSYNSPLVRFAREKMKIAGNAFARYGAAEQNFEEWDILQEHLDSPGPISDEELILQMEQEIARRRSQKPPDPPSEATESPASV